MAERSGKTMEIEADKKKLQDANEKLQQQSTQVQDNIDEDDDDFEDFEVAGN